MGLDDFTSDDSSSTGSSSSSSSSSSTATQDQTDQEPEQERERTYYGNGSHSTEPNYLTREGPVVPVQRPDIFSSTSGKIKVDDDNVRFHCPVFPHIDLGSDYTPGKRYELEYTGDAPGIPWDKRVVTCLGSYQTALGNLTREQAMLHVGSNDKEEIVDRFHTLLGGDVDNSTNVTVYFFGDTLHMRDLGQANDSYREGTVINRDKLVQNILHPDLLTVSLEQRAGHDEE